VLKRLCTFRYARIGDRRAVFFVRLCDPDNFAPPAKRAQHIGRWHLGRDIHVIDKNRSPPLTILFFLPDLKVARSLGNFSASFFCSQGEFVPAPIEMPLNLECEWKLW
jgi:hypothetical protein